MKKAAAKTGYADRIRFGSFIADEDLSDHYRAADIFVLCSRYEPFGMTAIEAMASGTPTVVTVHGGLYRALSFGRHALFAEPFDREDLGITIPKIFRHPAFATGSRAWAPTRREACSPGPASARRHIGTSRVS